MNIFNSLGSNYTTGFIVKSLIQNESGAMYALKRFLEKKYKGNVLFFYKAREAITYALKLSSAAKTSQVALAGFTCIAVVDAVKKAGLEPIFLDIDKNSLQFSPDTLEKAVSHHPNIQAVIIQNTLGYPCDIDAIYRFCKKKKIVLIEDLAHSAGSTYKNGEEAGSVGDFVVLSFSQDKVIDGVSGGALIIKNSKQQTERADIGSKSKPPRFQDHYYPISTWAIRNLYRLHIGKILHKILVLLGLLSNPMKVPSVLTFTNWHAMLALQSFHNLEKQLDHRRKIAKIYSEHLPESILSFQILKEIKYSANLRFPIFTQKRKEIVSALQKHGVYISDIWYDAPIAPKKYLENSGYKKGECPHAEETSEKILNLPTHINVSKKDAIEISKIISTYLSK